MAAAAPGIGFGEGDGLREAVDLDVPASRIGPFDRPQPGGWPSRPEDFDALVRWRFDRAVRPLGDTHELARQVTTDPVPLRMIRGRRRPSSPWISRTRTGFCHPHGLAGRGSIRVRARRVGVRPAVPVATFYDTPLDTMLRNLGRDTVIVTGTLTNYCCGTTARQAYERGYKVVFGSDTTATDDESRQEPELAVLRKGFALVLTAGEITHRLIATTPAPEAGDSANVA